MSHHLQRHHGKLTTGCGCMVALFVLGVCAAAIGSSTHTANQNASSARESSPSPSEPAPSPVPSPRHTAVPAVASKCIQPDAPGSHVYSPDRLEVLNPCVTVTGYIDFIRHEADGDFHIGLRLDARYAGLVNACNRTCLNGAEQGDLVVEPVCMNTPTQADAVKSCVGYHNPLVIPPVGSHVQMTGAYVLDLDHGWTEIHPLMSVRVI